MIFGDYIKYELTLLSPFLIYNKNSKIKLFSIAHQYFKTF